MTEMSHSLARSLAQDVATESLGIQNLTGTRYLKSFLG